MNILVTGGAGFLGSHLCERLLKTNPRAHVFCLDNFSTGSPANVTRLRKFQNFIPIGRDVREPLTLAVDYIFHLACPASPVQYQKDPVNTIRTAVEGTINMFDLAKNNKARVLIASTSEVYGDPTKHPQTEGYWGNVNPVGPRSCYDEGKRCAESIAMAYAQQFKVESRIARIFNTYGPGMQIDDGRVISNFIVQALTGNPITIYGDGKQTRSLCYVDDLVHGLVKLMFLNIDTMPINLGNPEEISIIEIAETVRKMTKSKSNIVFEELPTDDPCRRKPDVSLARALLGWKPVISLRTGLAETIDYFKSLLIANGSI